MFNRENKNRKHTCEFCGHRNLNDYYGIKSYDDIPLYLIDFYELYKSRCAYCGTEFYYLTKIS